VTTRTFGTMATATGMSRRPSLQWKRQRLRRFPPTLFLLITILFLSKTSQAVPMGLLVLLVVAPFFSPLITFFLSVAVKACAWPPT
jgi:hypothetical protein